MNNNTDLTNIPEQEIRNKNTKNEVVDEKLDDAMFMDVSFDPEEAELAGAFKEDAISLHDAEESRK
ncbi:hypothetical protein A9G45_01315 [Gilliamella sp. HK2]|jgi:hypothetical protein|uniref:hypothetical protein n=1 Tax=unclassified Gilliamella TaxID=2685620 RepID=UPI00080E8FA7|nr:hypothetical protein [Gilliamella apicola]OCG28968.1 hypothetical protein A9G46_01620 [Gilliamella apicola]OCG31434.1 hypothetical protein A9G45_01315 [Gilliamella apicola]